MTEWGIVFSPAAEKLVEGLQGVVLFEMPPAGFGIGDTVCLRFAPNDEVHEFVCTARRFDCAQKGKTVFQATLSLPSEIPGR